VNRADSALTAVESRAARSCTRVVRV